MGMHLHAMRQRKGIALADRLGGGIPKTIGRAVEIPRPTHAGRETLDRAVCHDLDTPQAQVFCPTSLQRHGTLDRVTGLHAHQTQQGHDAYRVGHLIGDAQLGGNFIVAQGGGQVGGRGDPSAHTQLAESPDTCLVATQERTVQAHMASDRHHGFRPLQLTRRQAV